MINKTLENLKFTTVFTRLSLGTVSLGLNLLLIVGAAYTVTHPGESVLALALSGVCLILAVFLFSFSFIFSIQFLRWSGIEISPRYHHDE